MKRSLLVLLVLLASTSIFARTQPGKSAFAARITHLTFNQDSTHSGHEFGFGRMISPGAMILLDINLSFQAGSNEYRSGLITNKGPVHQSFSITGYPEYRFYLSPRKRVVPYFGLYALLGTSSMTQEILYNGYSKTENKMSVMVLGGGATLGAEFFLNNFISLAAHSRFVQYTFTSEKTVLNYNGRTLREVVDNSHQVGLRFEPALYVRLYF